MPPKLLLRLGAVITITTITYLRMQVCTPKQLCPKNSPVFIIYKRFRHVAPFCKCHEAVAAEFKGNHRRSGDKFTWYAYWKGRAPCGPKKLLHVYGRRRQAVEGNHRRTGDDT